MSEQPKSQEITLGVDPKVLQGRYSNAINVTSQERDVVIDFMSHVNGPLGNQMQLVSRIFMNHFVARDLIATLTKTLEQWEKMRYEKPENAK